MLFRTCNIAYSHLRLFAKLHMLNRHLHCLWFNLCRLFVSFLPRLKVLLMLNLGWCDNEENRRKTLLDKEIVIYRAFVNGINISKRKSSSGVKGSVLWPESVFCSWKSLLRLTTHVLFPWWNRADRSSETYYYSPSIPRLSRKCLVIPRFLLDSTLCFWKQYAVDFNLLRTLN